MVQVLITFLAGWSIGLLFSWWRLPIPAPPLMGLVGAFGLTIGDLCYRWLRSRLQ
jgi:XapX domain-containing protein